MYGYYFGLPPACQGLVGGPPRRRHPSGCIPRLLAKLVALTYFQRSAANRPHSFTVRQTTRQLLTSVRG